ncbi:hypothetical protein [Gemmata sp.]|uniref:hypothetical protein n=1 Tax=Gemmata sp. TaxID=1914242 RepID=UPI003F6EB9CE
MADKLTQQILDALTRAAAHPGGQPLYASKTDAGLFPNTSAAKTAVNKCVADGFVRLVAADPAKGRAGRELYALSDAGWEYLLAQVNPKQVLEDFVRVLEDRRGEVGELLATARHMADSLQGLKDAVARVLPAVTAARVTREPDRAAAFAPLDDRASIQTSGVNAARPEPAPTDLAPLVLARLADWSEATDCTLPELYRSLSVLDPAPTIGAFHDCLRTLFAAGTISLPAWTGPLYAMPEPAFAMMNGHGIAYYASLRQAGVRPEFARAARGTL